jgi:predicted DCC family thiol-disulfide oxidoreductase YuxK
MSKDAPSGKPLLPPGARLLLIYDGWCGVCTRTVEWVRRYDPAGRVAALPNQTPGLKERAGLTRTEVDRAAWVIDRAGRRLAGAAAINRTLEELGAWRLLARLYRLPGIRQLEDLAYALFAAHRGRFARWGSVPACERPGADCLPEGE